jgi:hypothetical protein
MSFALSYDYLARHILHTVKKSWRFSPAPVFPSPAEMFSAIPAGDGKTDNPFFTVYRTLPRSKTNTVYLTSYRVNKVVDHSYDSAV